MPQRLSISQHLQKIILPTKELTYPGFELLCVSLLSAGNFAQNLGNFLVALLVRLGWVVMVTRAKSVTILSDGAGKGVTKSNPSLVQEKNPFGTVLRLPKPALSTISLGYLILLHIFPMTLFFF